MKKGMKKWMAYLLVTSMGLATFAPRTMVSSQEVSGSAVEEEKATATATPAPTATAEASQTPVATAAPETWTVKVKKASHPKKLSQGAGFTVKGTLKASKKMKTVVATIKNDEGETLCKKKLKVNKKKASLKKVDSSMKFSELKPGKYTYTVTATNKAKDKKTVISDDFKVKKCKWQSPVRGGNWGDGWHCHCAVHRGKHYGWDALGGKRDIYSVADGTVVYAKYHAASSLASFGKLIVIYHGKGIYSYYAHCSRIKVDVGDKVSGGDKIGVTGSTGYAFGTHLHFEMRKGPDFDLEYNSISLLDKYTYKQFNPAKKIKNR